MAVAPTDTTPPATLTIANGEAVALDTLALGGNCPSRPEESGSSESDSEGTKAVRRLHKVARKKYLSAATAASLWRENFGTGDPLLWAYGRSLDCADVAEQETDGKIRRHYCKNRWCVTCNSIRTARDIKRYGPILDTWEDGWLVTLTVRNVSAEQLRGRIEEMISLFARIRDSLRKKPYSVNLVALRHLEVTWNGKEDTYHPHFHVLVRGVGVALLVEELWLRKYGDEANRKGQDIRPYTGNPAEVFKYTTKLVQERKAIPARQLSVIFNAMRGKCVVQPFGIRGVPSLDETQPDEDFTTEAVTNAVSRPGERVLWAWTQGAGDYVDLSTGEVLTGYEPSPSFVRLVESFSTPDQVMEAEVQVARARQQRDLERHEERKRGWHPDTERSGEATDSKSVATAD